MTSCKYPTKLTLIRSHGLIPTENTDKYSDFCQNCINQKDIVTILVKILIFDMIGIRLG